MPLTDAKLRTLKPEAKPTKHSDSGGLHVLVTPTGSKLWRMSYRFAGKQKTLALGSYPIISLIEARQKRDTAKKLIAHGNDPALQAKLEKAQRKHAHSNTFNVLADKLLEKDEREGRAPATLKKKKWLLAQARPDLGNRPISEISAVEILVPLRKVEAKGNLETARRMRSTIGEVFRLAIANALAKNDPTFGLKGALITPTVQHRAAFTTERKFAGLIRAVWQYDGMPETRAALQLMALLYPRPGELRHAEWIEFDFENSSWTIPASRTKTRKEHKKPLPSAAVRILQEIQKLTEHRTLVLPSAQSPLRPMSENTFNGALRRLGFSKNEVTAHGFRASASSLLNESGHWSSDAIEAELGHVGADQVRKAYHRALYWEERVKMAEWWAGQICAFSVPLR